MSNRKKQRPRRFAGKNEHLHLYCPEYIAG